MFSTQPNNVALDGVGRNSPFAAALAKYVATPGLEVRQMISKVRGDVLEATNQKQVPWDSSSLVGDLYLAGAAPAAASSAAPVLAQAATPTPAPTPIAPAGDSQQRQQVTKTGPAAECQKIGAPAPDFADPAIIKASHLPKDWNRALGFCKQAVEADPNAADLRYDLGTSYYNTKDYLSAVHQLTMAADAGNADARTQLGFMFVTGRGRAIFPAGRRPRRGLFDEVSRHHV